MREWNRRRVLAAAAAIGGGLMLAGCSRLGTLNALNALTPGDGGVRQLVDGAAFGPDPRQRLDVYAPVRPASANQPALPVVIFFYGGSWSFGSRTEYGFAARALAARGFVVVVPDYRVVPQVVFPGFIDDGAAALRWVVDNIAQSGGDPRRIGLAGHSAGAYNAMMLGLDREFATRAGVAPGTIRAVVGLAGPYDFLPFDTSASINAFGKAPDPVLTQPVHYARADAPPVLLLTGDADDTVRPKNSIALDAALKRAGAVSELKIYLGLGHIGILLAVSKPFRGKADVLESLVRFLQQRLA